MSVNRLHTTLNTMHNMHTHAYNHNLHHHYQLAHPSTLPYPTLPHPYPCPYQPFRCVSFCRFNARGNEVTGTASEGVEWYLAAEGSNVHCLDYHSGQVDA